MDHLPPPHQQQPDQSENPATPPYQDQQNQQALDNLELKSARTLATVATVAGPVSLIIGGVALSIVAIVCAGIALTKVRRILARTEQGQRSYALALRQTARMGIGVGIVALVLNGVSVAMMMPVLLDAMRTGDYSAILGDAAAQLPTAPNPSNGGGNAWG